MLASDESQIIERVKFPYFPLKRALENLLSIKEKNK